MEKEVGPAGLRSNSNTNSSSSSSRKRRRRRRRQQFKTLKGQEVPDTGRMCVSGYTRKECRRGTGSLGTTAVVTARGRR